MSIPVILASKSPSRRALLNTAGVCPTIRVSHVDEPAALRQAAEREGIGVDELTVRQRVMILAQAKAQAVHEAYRQVAHTAAAACGEQVTAWPLRAESVDSVQEAEASREAQGVSSDVTRDFSGVQVPLEHELIGESSAMRGGLRDHATGPLIVGCDSMFMLDGQCYGKPHTVEVARERLHQMRGATGELWTGHCVIDLATDRMVSDASRALVHFAAYSDDDIERYVATGEPLEVAGSFTLEGFGGAFIDGIEGDPHGVVGVSLPLLRQLVGQLGVAWPDLWNTLPEQSEESKAQGVANHAAHIEPPKENVHQPGDGWVDCHCGRKHWGLNGASGVLLARRDEQSGEVTHVVMQHRAMWSAEGGTWGIPGGATADGENPIEGALRESFEEANITPDDIEVRGTYREDHGNWAYTTVFAVEKPGHRVQPRANDDESMEIAWVPIEDVPNRKLLTAMRTDWPRFEAMLRRLSGEPSV